jgi:aquaporin Z
LLEALCSKAFFSRKLSPILSKGPIAEGGNVASTTAIFLAELLGTFFLTFAGAGSILQSAAMGESGYGLLGIAIAHGLVLSVVVSATAGISGGHINPAITIGLFLGGKVPPRLVPLYLIAQCLGSFLGALALRVIFAPAIIAAVALGTPVPAAGVSFNIVVFVELILTFFLALAVWGTAVDPRSPRIGGFGIGLAVLVGILVGGPITGAAMNPARVLGPALAGGGWSAHAAYWIGPIVGAAAASLLYRRLLLEKR